jgi:hypothetical protein
MSRFDMISTFFQTMYGNPVALALQKSSWPVLESATIQDNSTVDDMPWLTTNLSLCMYRPHTLSHQGKILIGHALQA